jgi:hypothetical protein
VSKKLERKLEEIADDFGQRCAETMLDFAWFDANGSIRGDVEYAMTVALRAMNCGYGWEFDGHQVVVQEWNEANDCPIVQIQPSKMLAGFRIAFAIRVSGPNRRTMRIAVQCDGHDFHEMSPEQAIQEKNFEKALATGRYRLMRFSGEEITDDPAKCASKVAAEIDAFITPRKRRGA